MRISEAAARSGLSIDTIRYYERTGLAPPAGRGADGQRRFSSENVEWLTLLASLRETRMPMKQMRRFAWLYQQGHASVAERKRMLLEHADHLERQRAALDRCAELLRYKLAKYDEIMGDGA
ncbi:MAG: MerR family transcriptional regulator [Pseudomonadota bacterium]